MALTSSDLEAIAKRLYRKGDVEEIVYKDHPFFAMVKKVPGFRGSAKGIAVIYEDAMGRSNTFTQAQSADTDFKSVQFLLTRVRDYAVGKMYQEDIMAATDDGAFVAALQKKMDSTYRALANSLAFQLYRVGNSSRGRVTVSSTTLTLSNRSDVANFAVGMKIVCSDSETNQLRNNGTGQTITAVNRSAGTLTINANTDSIVTNDYIWVKGDRTADAITLTSQYTNIAGLGAWLPSSAPSASESFFGVDRSADTNRLGGIRTDISTMLPEEGLMYAMTEHGLQGAAAPTHLFLNYLNYNPILNALGSKANTIYGQIGTVGFTGVEIASPMGPPVKIFPDVDCPVNVGFLLNLPTWELHHLGELINNTDRDGNILDRVYNADQMEWRKAFYGNLGCVAPGYNQRLTLPTAS